MLIYNQITELFDAVATGNVKKVKDLLESGIDVNTHGSYRCKDGTPLHHVIRSICCLEYSIENAEWDDDCRRDYKRLNNLLKIFNLLIQRGADLNAKDEDSDTPLHYAVMAGDIEVDEVPLVKFEHTNMLYVAKTLIEQGANVNMKNQNNETPFDCTPSISAAMFLEEHGALVDA